MVRIFSYKIDNKAHGQTVEAYLKARGYAQKILARLRRTENGILIEKNGMRTKVYTTYRLIEGDTLMIHLIEEESSDNIVPVQMPLDIVYEDEDLMIINKASGVPIHPSQGNYENTLANGLTFYFQEKGQAFVYRAINRLDRDTTGLLIVAKNQLSAGILSQMVADTKNRQIHRTYLAIVTGILGRVGEEGTIDAPIARVADSTIERQVDFVRGERAITHYKVLAQRNNNNNNYTLVQLKLETGRTHQIRVHMTYLGHSLPGDFLYNPDDKTIERQALHSWKLAFRHPITGKELDFRAPLPEDMRVLFFGGDDSYE